MWAVNNNNANIVDLLLARQELEINKQTDVINEREK
jgi:hypothetical protein